MKYEVKEKLNSFGEKHRLFNQMILLDILKGICIE